MPVNFSSPDEYLKRKKIGYYNKTRQPQGRYQMGKLRSFFRPVDINPGLQTPESLVKKFRTE